MATRIDGDNKERPNLGFKRLQIKHDAQQLEMMRLQQQVQKIQERKKALEGKKDEEVAIKGFHFEYTNKTQFDLNAMYQEALDAQQKEIQEKLNILEQEIDNEKNRIQAELKSKQEQQAKKEEKEKFWRQVIYENAPKFYKD